MHDASEAYLNDLNSPVKHLIQGDYKRMERELEACVAKKWGLCYKDGWPEAVQKADNLAFRLEVIRLFDYGNPLWQYYKIDPAEYKAAPYRIAELQNPEQAMMGFLMRYHELFDKQVTEDPGTEVIFAG